MGNRQAHAAKLCFNRTIVGLKFEGVVGFPERARSFNRTIVGLKWRLQQSYRHGWHSFNRTIVGLKYRPYRCACISVIIVLIELL